jgi:DNA-binding NarL/FixJ family response regulator
MDAEGFLADNKGMSSVPQEITVAVVEDDVTIRAGWVDFLKGLDGYIVAGEFGSGEEALAELTKNPPDFVLMDINLPGMSGIECTRELKQQMPYVEILMLTMFSDLSRIFDALRAGASGYLLKRTSPEALKAAMEEIRLGGAPMSRFVARQILEHFRHFEMVEKPAKEPSERVENLSPKESEILKFLAEGCLYKEIADEVNVHIETVRTHIRRIYAKLHVRSRTEATVKYLESKRSKERAADELERHGGPKGR